MHKQGSVCDEAATFRSRCAATIAQLDVLLNETRFQRGLVIDWKPHARLGIPFNTWGVGHMLTLAYRLHAMCFRLRRYCYLRLYDSGYEEYFTFTNGWEWAIPGRRLLRRYAAMSDWQHLRMNCSQAQIHRQYVENELEPALVGQEAPLIVLEIIGWIPFEPTVSTFVAATGPLQGIVTASLMRTPAALHRVPGLDPCVCRYVTEPPAARQLEARARPTSVHLRTGFADVDDSVARA
jgi:hypothetical protein